MPNKRREWSSSSSIYIYTTTTTPLPPPLLVRKEKRKILIDVAKGADSQRSAKIVKSKKVYNLFILGTARLARVVQPPTLNT